MKGKTLTQQEVNRENMTGATQSLSQTDKSGPPKVEVLHVVYHSNGWHSDCILHRLCPCGKRSSFLTSTRSQFYLHLLRMLRNYKLKNEHSWLLLSMETHVYLMFAHAHTSIARVHHVHWSDVTNISTNQLAGLQYKWACLVPCFLSPLFRLIFTPLSPCLSRNSSSLQYLKLRLVSTYWALETDCGELSLLHFYSYCSSSLAVICKNGGPSFRWSGQDPRFGYLEDRG